MPGTDSQPSTQSVTPGAGLSRGARILAAVALAIVAVLLPPSRGPFTWALLGVAGLLLSAIVSGGPMTGNAAGRLRRAVRRTLAVGSAAMFALVFLEIGLAVHEGVQRKRLAAGEPTSFLTVPPEWERRWIAPGNYEWHGKSHRVDVNMMRRTTPVPDPRPDVLRIVVVGDSNTFGQAVDVNDAYAAVLERRLAPTHRVEVLNLGVCGYNAADCTKRLEDWMPSLAPGLVVYGMCLNDFLDAGDGISGPTTDSPAVSKTVRRLSTVLTRRTRAAPVLARSWGDLMMRLGVSDTLLGQVHKDIGRLGPRFAREVDAMNRLVTGSGRPAVIAMVINQFPGPAGESLDLTEIAERSMREAGMDVVPVLPFLRAHAGEQFTRSRFDGHPNERAHGLFADLLAERIRAHETLARFALDAAATPPDRR